MGTDTENLVLEHLRNLRNRLDEVADDQGNRLSRIETRLSSIEHTVGSMYATAGDDRETMQSFRTRLERIERRLELRPD